MDGYLKEALEIVKAQATVRTMAEDDIISMVKKVADGIKPVSEGCGATNSYTELFIAFIV